MIRGAVNALSAVLTLNPGENVLIITDEDKKAIGEAFSHGAKELGGKPEMYQLEEKLRPLKNIPQGLIFSDYSVVLNIFSAFAEETPFRVQLTTQEMKSGAKVGHAPGITESMMIDGAMNANFKEIAKKAFALMDAFANAAKVNITTPTGTDITMDILAREFETDVIIAEGSIGNLPAGEIWCAPVENSGNGIIVVDGSIGDIGPPPKPLKIEVRDGKIVAMECDDQTLIDRVRELTAVDEEASIIGELGIGLNPNAKLTGVMLEDEKAGGTAHIAFGNNIEMPGGQNNSMTHRDFLFYKPTFKVTFTDGSERIIIKDGELVIE
jgi:leucyl aminopeptidase (aminopeptidase T)